MYMCLHHLIAAKTWNFFGEEVFEQGVFIEVDHFFLHLTK